MMEGVNLRYTVNSSINGTMYSQYNNNMLIKKFQGAGEVVQAVRAPA
jgi:hypothetical protein